MFRLVSCLRVGLLGLGSLVFYVCLLRFWFRFVCLGILVCDFGQFDLVCVFCVRNVMFEFV